MEPKIKKQKGYLLLVAVILIVIVAFISTIVAYIFIGRTSTSGNLALSNDAFYIANSGIEIAKRDILMRNIQCNAINGQSKYTNASLFNGQFTVTGTAKIATAYTNQALNATSTSIPITYTTLSGSISATTNTITLASTANFTNNGSIRIDNELMSYTGKSGNTLLNVARGIAGTNAASHSSGATVLNGFSTSGTAWIGGEEIAYTGISGNVLQNVIRGFNSSIAVNHANGEIVSQNQCALIAAAGVPTLATAHGKRVIMQLVRGQTLSVPGAGIAAIASFGNVNLNGTPFVINPVATFDGANYSGHTIISHGHVNINGTGGTKINSNSGLIISSTSQDIRGDVIQHYDSSLTLAKFFQLFFTKTYSQIKSEATITVPGINLNASNQTVAIANTSSASVVRVAGNISVNGNKNTIIIGNTTSPVTVIVEGNISINGGKNTLIAGNVANSKVPIILITEGDYSINGGNIATLFGFAYIMGNFNINGTAEFHGAGMLAVQGDTNFNGSGEMVFDPSILNLLGISNTAAAINYVSKHAVTQELFK